jgi:plastocyanin
MSGREGERRTAMKAAVCSTLLVAAVVMLGGCGGGGSSTSGSGTCTPGRTASVAVSATGFSPVAVCITPDGSVTFTNGDTVAHDIESGVTCTALNLGEIPAGQSKTATFPTETTCPFFDAAHSTDTAFQGTVAVSTNPTTGPGY